MPGRPHEVASQWLNAALHDSVAGMGMVWNTHLISLGSTDIEHKEPDVSLQPVILPPGRSPEWPTLVVETGRSESQLSLDNNTRWWLRRSNGDVEVVITTRVSRTKLVVKRWAMTGRTRASILQTITIEKATPIHITGGPLRTPFRDVFLRDPVAIEGDFVYGQADLEQWACRVWDQF